LIACTAGHRFAGATEAVNLTQSPAVEEVQSPGLTHEVFAIFRNRCLRCHETGNEEGGFRLDTHEGILQGGHTGLSVLGKGSDGEAQSELIKRIKSEDTNYRMPKNAPALAESEIEKITTWVRSTASWPEDEISRPAIASVAVGVAPAKLNADWDINRRLNEGLDFAVSLHEMVGFLQWPLLIFLLVMLWIENRKKILETRKKMGDLNSSPSASERFFLGITSTHYFCVLLIFSLVGTMVYHVRSTEKLLLKIQLKQISSADFFSEGPPTRPPDEKDPPVYRPFHPVRLGGEYYRGNDERNKELFNGGYYRTATMRISLRDDNGKLINWNESIGTSECFIHLEIEKAPYATPSLFTKEVMGQCFLSQGREVNPQLNKDADAVYLSESLPLQKWEASYRLGDPATWREGETSGMIYLYNGTPQYGIKYDIHLVDGVINNASEIWMGPSLLPGNVDLPEDQSITLAEWFDFLPIPEITQPNSTDPVVLGIPEHEQKAAGRKSSRESSPSP